MEIQHNLARRLGRGDSVRQQYLDEPSNNRNTSQSQQRA